MGWETRRNGWYYYRSRKVGGRVVKEYLGAGPVGAVAAKLDAHQRAERVAWAEATGAERARLAEAEAPLAELCTLTDALTKGALLLAGYHQHHRGEWRRRRGQREQGRDQG